MARKRKKENPAEKALLQGIELVKQTTLFLYMFGRVYINRDENNRCPDKGWAVVTNHGSIHVNPLKKGTPEEWQYVISHCLLHLGFNHFSHQASEKSTKFWNVACDYRAYAQTQNPI